MLTRHQTNAYSTLMWVGFLTFCLVPLVAVGVNVGRYFYARAEMYKAADAAALAAAQEVDVELYRLSGELRLTDSAFSLAQSYGGMASSYLTTRRIYPSIIAIEVRQTTVFVRMAARTDDLIPLLGTLTLYGEAEAEVRVGEP